jgi:hypothetical protein
LLSLLPFTAYSRFRRFPITHSLFLKLWNHQVRNRRRAACKALNKKTKASPQACLWHQPWLNSIQRKKSKTKQLAPPKIPLKRLLLLFYFGTLSESAAEEKEEIKHLFSAEEEEEIEHLSSVTQDFKDQEMNRH